MPILPALSRLEKILIDNSPALLTAVGVAGTLTTAVMTGKASIKAYEILKETEREFPDLDVIPPREKIRLTWKMYIPAACVGGLTVAAIVGANHIGSRRAAGIAAAYTISERLHSEYKDMVIEKLGPEKERAMRDELAQRRVTENPPTQEIVLIGDEVQCRDGFSGRYFKSSTNALLKAQNDINARVIQHSYASLTDLYDLLDIPKTSVSDEVGWNHETMLDMQFSYTGDENGNPCLNVDFEMDSTRDYWKNR